MLVTNIIIELELTKYIVTFKNNYEKLSIILNIKKKLFLAFEKKRKTTCCIWNIILLFCKLKER